MDIFNFIKQYEYADNAVQAAIYAYESATTYEEAADAYIIYKNVRENYNNICNTLTETCVNLDDVIKKSEATYGFALKEVEHHINEIIEITYNAYKWAYIDHQLKNNKIVKKNRDHYWNSIQLATTNKEEAEYDAECALLVLQSFRHEFDQLKIWLDSV